MNEQMRQFQLGGVKARAEVESFIQQQPIDRQRAMVRKYLSESENYRVNILQTIRTFESLSHEQLRFGAQSMEDVFYKKGEMIIQQEDIGDSFFIVERGTVSVTKKSNVNDPDEVPMELVQLGADTYFGHLALVTDEPRSATISAVSDTVKCLKMTKAIFAQIRDASDALSALGREKIGLQVLNNLPNFQNLTLRVKKDLLKAMKNVPFPANTYICRQGSVGNTFYVIMEGKCRVTVATDDGREKELRTFFPGDYFGETALISSDSIRTANVISTGYVQCLCLSRVDFSTLLSSAASAIMEQSLNRQKETAEAANNTGVSKRERRRISAFGEDGKKHAGMTGILFHRMGKFMTQSLFLSMYWKMYRAMVLHPHKKELYGPIAVRIMAAHIDSTEARFFTCDAIRTEALRILRMLPSRRNGDEHSFVIGLFAQPNQLRKNLCPDWPENKWQSLCKRIRYKHSVEALRKVNDVGDVGTSAMLVLQGAARLHANYHDDATNKSSLVYEEDINSGELFHIAALGGMHRRLLAATAMTNVDLAEIEYDAFLDAKGNDVYTLSTDEKYRFLENVPLFKGWEPYALYLVAQQLQHEDCRIGTKLLSTAKYTDKIYFLLHGKINILSNVNRTSTMATMQRYDYFGESSVLNHFFADPANVAGHFQTKKERRIIRNGKNKRHPKVYYELTDAVTGSNAEFLVLHKKDFNLLMASSVEAMRAAYYKRAVGRLQRSKLLYQEEKTAKGFRQNFVAVAKLAMEEDNPNAYYNANIPNEYEGKIRNAGKLNYPPIKDAADSEHALEDGITTVSHGSMHNSAVQMSLHLTGRANGFVQPNHLKQLVHGGGGHDDDLKGSFLPLAPNSPVKGTLPRLPDSPLPVRPNTSAGLMGGGRAPTAQKAADRFPTEVRHVEDIPGVLNGLWNPVALLGTCKTDKDRNKVQKMLKETYKVRSASDMHSKLGDKERAQKAGLTRSLSDKVIRSRPNTAGHVSVDGDTLMGMNKDTHRLSEFLRGSHQLHAGKHYHETLHPHEIINFRPSTSRTKSKNHR